MPAALSKFLPDENLSLEEFQRFAETHDGLWELYDGVPVKMQSASPEHQWICSQIQSQFMNYFQNKNCIPLPELDVCVSKQIGRCSTRKPDLLVFCDKNQLKKNLIYSPQLVVEVWSPSNSTKERMDKVMVYQRAGVREFWQIDYGSRDFAIISFKDRMLVSVSGGDFQEEIVSEYFPGLRVTLAGYADFAERIR